MSQPEQPDAAAADAVLAVDLDGTLVANDLGRDHALAYVRKGPLAALRVLGWLLAGGRLRVKEEVAVRIGLEPDRLTWRSETIDFVRAQRAAGRKVTLATAAARPYAEAAAAKLGLFDDILCSSADVNLYGVRKADRLDEEYGKGGWDYIGDSPEQDSPVFARARVSHFVRPTPAMLASARQAGTSLGVRPSDAQRRRTILRLLKPGEWLINACLLLLLPLPQLLDESSLAAGLIALAACCCASSGAAAIGAIMDLSPAHRTRGQPALADGGIGVMDALRMAGLCALALALLALALPLAAAGLIAGYMLLAAVRSAWLAAAPLADVAARTGAHVLRMAAGFAAAGFDQPVVLLAGAAALFAAAEGVRRRMRAPVS